MVDTVSIDAAIRSYKRVIQVLHTEESVSKAEFYYNEAVAVRANPESIQEALDKAATDLMRSINLLVPKQNIDSEGVVILDLDQAVVKDEDVVVTEEGSVELSVEDRVVTGGSYTPAST